MPQLHSVVKQWCLDDENMCVLYKSSGEIRYEGFKLYKMIARRVHRHTPAAQLEPGTIFHKLFATCITKEEEVEKKEKKEKKEENEKERKKKNEKEEIRFSVFATPCRFALDVNATDGSGATPLMFAALVGNVDIIRKLLKRGAKVNSQVRDME
jgi:ankyrin repeat protein